jgi:hypothetical protein
MLRKKGIEGPQTAPPSAPVTELPNGLHVKEPEPLGLFEDMRELAWTQHLGEIQERSGQRGDGDAIADGPIVGVEPPYAM